MNRLPADMPLMEVEYPSELQISGQRERILEALPPLRSLWERIKAVYWGPGLRVIFYHCRSAMLITVFLYLAVVLYIARIDVARAELRALGMFGLFPMCFLLFSYYTCREDEQEAVVELKNSMHYHTRYLTGLRMLYASIGMILVNLCILAVLGGYRGLLFWKLAAAGSSGMFLFALAAVWLYHRFGDSLSLGILLGVWGGCLLVIRGQQLRVLRFVTDEIPLMIHVLAAVFCLCMVLYYIGLLERRDEYSFA